MVLRIGFDAKRLFFNPTGLGNYSRTLLRNLAEYYPENEYHLFTPDIKGSKYYEEFSSPPFYIHRPSSYLDSIFWRSWRQSYVINNLHLDVYHGLSHEIPFGIHANTKKVVTFHDLIYERIKGAFPIWDTIGYKLKYQSSARRADHVISVSRQTASDLHAIYKISPSKITTIYQAVGDHFTTLTPKVHDGQYLLYVGSIIPRKGLDNIIRALGMIEVSRRPKLMVIGEGPFKPVCIELASELDLSSWIDWQGQVDNKLLLEIYDKAIATILPSIYEGFGIPMVESLLRYTPVITSKDSAMSEAAGPGGIMIDPTSARDIANAITLITSDNHKRTTLAETGNRYVREEFNSKSVTKQIIKLYQGLIN